MKKKTKEVYNPRTIWSARKKLFMEIDGKPYYVYDCSSWPDEEEFEEVPPEEFSKEEE